MATWATYANLLDTFNIARNPFVKWGLASICLKIPQWQDTYGTDEMDKEQAMGMPVKHKSLYPDRILTLYKTSDYGNQSKDVQTSEEKVGLKIVLSKPIKGSFPKDTRWVVKGWTRPYHFEWKGVT